MREHSGRWEEVDSGQLRAAIKADPLRDTQEVAKNSVLAILLSFDIWSKLKRWKSLISGCLVSWLKLKKIVLKCLLLYAAVNHFLIRLWHTVKKWIWYSSWGWPALWLNGEEAPKHFPKSNLHPKKGHHHWWSAAGLIHCSFLNPSKTTTAEKYAQQINEIHQKLQSLQPVLVTEWAWFSTATLDHTSHNQHFRSWMNWATKLYFICRIRLTSRQLTTTSSSVSTTLQGYCYHLSKFYIYALVYCIGVFLSGLLHSV